MFLLTIDLLIPEAGLLIWNLLAFLIVFFILKKFAWPVAACSRGCTTRSRSTS